MSQVIGTNEHHDMWSWPCRKAETRLGSRLEASRNGLWRLKEGPLVQGSLSGPEPAFFVFVFVCLFIHCGY